MRHFSVRPAITLKGRKFKGLRGWAGKPFHPPLTDFPIVAYVFAAAFDVVSLIGGRTHAYAGEFWHAGAYVLVGGVVVSVLAALTGLFDWLRSSQPGTQARRTANTHATTTRSAPTNVPLILALMRTLAPFVLTLPAKCRFIPTRTGASPVPEKTTVSE